MPNKYQYVVVVVVVVGTGLTALSVAAYIRPLIVFQYLLFKVRLACKI